MLCYVLFIPVKRERLHTYRHTKAYVLIHAQDTDHLISTRSFSPRLPSTGMLTLGALPEFALLGQLKMLDILLMACASFWKFLCAWDESRNVVMEFSSVDTTLPGSRSRDRFPRPPGTHMWGVPGPA